MKGTPRPVRRLGEARAKRLQATLVELRMEHNMSYDAIATVFALYEDVRCR